MSMKTMILFLLLALGIFLVGLAVWQQQPPLPETTLVKNEIILPKGAGEYMEVRHIVVKGTNEEIGRVLGDIARKDFGSGLSRYASPLYGREQQKYMKNNYPILLDRMTGVAGSYGLVPGDGNYDTSSLPYGIGPAACSLVYFPGNVTADGHARYSRNMDYFIVTPAEVFGNANAGSDEKLCSKNYVLELYPDSGYPSIVIGSFDLLNAPLDGMNSQGVTVSMLVDNDAAQTTVTDSSRASGLSTFQAMRLVLDTATDVDAAKRIILANNVTMLSVPLHMLIADRSGRSFIAEMSDKDFQWHFTDNVDKPQILTNHAVYKYPDTGTFPSIPATDEYNSFNRYRKLDAYITSHKGQFTEDDALNSMSLVKANTDLAMEGGSRPLPMRTVWTSVFDLEERSAKVSFYLKDGKKDPEKNPSGLVFSPQFTFRLDRDKISINKG